MDTYKLIEELEKCAAQLEEEALKPESDGAVNKEASEDVAVGSAYIDTLVKAMGL